MNDKEYYELISNQLKSLDEKITRLFKKSDAMQTMITEHKVKINLIYGFSITAMTCVIGLVGKILFEFFSKFGGTP